MAQILHEISIPNDGNGDPLRVGFDNQNTMNTELYNNKVDKVTGKGLSDVNFSSTDKAKLDAIEEGSEENVQSDWLQEDDTQDDYIKNKPEFLSVYIHDFLSAASQQDFTIPSGFTINSVFLNRTFLVQSEYTFTSNILTIIETLETGTIISTR